MIYEYSLNLTTMFVNTIHYCHGNNQCHLDYTLENLLKQFPLLKCLKVDRLTN